MLLGGDDDYFVGGEVINTSTLIRDSNRLIQPHPLFEIFTYTREPIRGAYTKLRHTINDVYALVARQMSMKVMASLDEIDGKSDSALFKAQEFFADLQAGTFEKSHSQSSRPSSSNNPQLPHGRGGLVLVYEQVISIISALINLKLDSMDVSHIVKITKDSAGKKNRFSALSSARLANLLVFGPASFWTCPTDPRKTPQYKSLMLIEFGCVVLDSKMRNGEPEQPVWGHFGNTRVHILETLVEMGFDGKKEVDWKNVIQIFLDKFSYQSLAEVIMQDVLLVADLEEGAVAETVWAVERGRAEHVIETLSTPTASTSRSLL